MFKQCRLIRALRYATIALFMAAGVEAVEHFVFPSLSALQSHIAATLACAAIVAFLTLQAFSREGNKPQQFSETDLQLRDISKRRYPV